jgi:hypothetical protein
MAGEIAGRQYACDHFGGYDGTADRRGYLATQYGLKRALVALMVGVGTRLAFMTASGWWELLSVAT